LKERNAWGFTAKRREKFGLTAASWHALAPVSLASLFPFQDEIINGQRAFSKISEDKLNHRGTLQ
jgi:hypothetical protein